MLCASGGHHVSASMHVAQQLPQELAASFFELAVKGEIKGKRTVKRSSSFIAFSKSRDTRLCMTTATVRGGMCSARLASCAHHTFLSEGDLRRETASCASPSVVRCCVQHATDCSYALSPVACKCTTQSMKGDTRTLAASADVRRSVATQAPQQTRSSYNTLLSNHGQGIYQKRTLKWMRLSKF